jgi:signal transduction histidine kinase
MITKAVKHAGQEAVAERELSEYLSHEVCNPLAAALSACSFVSLAVHEQSPLMDDESRQSVREDVGVIHSSLRFINELLRSMLDLHRAVDHRLKLHRAPTDICHDVLELVASMLYRRDMNFELMLECPKNLMVETAIPYG